MLVSQVIRRCGTLNNNRISNIHIIYKNTLQDVLIYDILIFRPRKHEKHGAVSKLKSFERNLKKCLLNWLEHDNI